MLTKASSDAYDKTVMKISEGFGGRRMNQNTLLGILIPFAGTTLGSAMVFFMKKGGEVNAGKTHVNYSV